MRNTMIGALIAGIIALLIGLGIGFVFRNVQLKSAQADSQSLIEQAERKANELTKQAKVEAEILKKEAENLEKEKILALKEEGQKRRESIENEFIETRTELKASEKRLKQREEILDRKDDTLTRKEQSLDSKEENLSNKTNTLSKREEALSQIEAEKAAELARIASLSHDEAKEIILNQTKGSLSKEMAQLIRASEEKATAEADKKAKNIITLAMQRVSGDFVSEQTVSVVTLPDDGITNFLNILNTAPGSPGDWAAAPFEDGTQGGEDS